MTFSEFIRAKLGTSNWIVGRDCIGNRVRYGDDAMFLSQARFREIKAEFERQERANAA
jgi:hypothetical protein